MAKAIHPNLTRAIDESFAPFLRQHAFRQVPNGIKIAWAAKRAVIYDGPDYRLVFELDRSNSIGVVARAINDRLRGGTLQFLLAFLSGSNKNGFRSFRAQAEQLPRYHNAIADLLCGRDEERYRTFVRWVEENWTQLTEQEHGDASEVQSQSYRRLWIVAAGIVIGITFLVLYLSHAL
jgi:hypothetical protein